MKEHIIWQNIDFVIEDWQDYFKEQYTDEELAEMSDEQKYDDIMDLNDMYLEDERMNLDIPVCIIGIADLGLWNGRCSGYKIYHNLKDILYSDCDYVKWYVEGLTLKGELHHHDGTNYVTYYVFNQNLKGADKFLEDIYNNQPISKSRLYHYCKSAGKLVKEVYGF